MKFIRAFFYLSYLDRTLIISAITCVLNLVIGVSKFSIGLAYSSGWLVMNAVYYILLALAKGRVIYKWERILHPKLTECHPKQEELKLLHQSGVFQILIALSYFMVSWYTLYHNETPHYSWYVVVFVVIVTIEKVLFAIYGLIRTYQIHSPVVGVLKMINFTDAIFSLVVMQGVIQNTHHCSFGLYSSGQLGMICSVIFLVMGVVMCFWKVKQ